MRSTGPRSLAWLWLPLLTAASCSASSPAAGSGGGRPSAGGGAAGTAGSAAAGSGSNSTQLVVPTSMPTPGAEVSDACTGTIQSAREVQVDMYVMLDRSGSMQEKTGAGPSKWDAIGDALRAFVQDPQSQGLGVGLQYFPLAVPGVPETCSRDSDCGSGGNCVYKVCVPSALVASSGLTPCLSDADCPAFSQGCQPFGTCSGNTSLACFDIGKGGCDTQGDCIAYPGSCTNYTSCSASDYAKPAVALGTLPGNASALQDSLGKTRPLGNTPTSPALSGALDFATTQARSNPDHRVIAVLATDGLPTECLGPQVTSAGQAIAEAASIASRGLAATPSIPTYVIGVFSPDDNTSKSNLQKLAGAGGTKQAFIVDQSQDVTQQLLEALAKIRSGSLDCEYSLPDAQGMSLDFNAVNVQLTLTDSTTQNMLYVRDVGQCSKAKLGWYYDADPAQGGTPSKITICPDSCTSLRAQSGASLQIRLGCATMGPG